VLRNAYIEAFKGEIDNDITLNDAFKTFKEDYKAKRTEKKAERKAERAEKKETRQEKREERKKEWQQKRAERNREK
ncbi:MAG: hypothetical protein H7319_18560, partial [Spirosoma sp.]|nr:hypothetical protein [Spirosoma sp.]